VNPLTGGGALNAVAAKADFAVKRDAQGTAMIRFLPDTKFVDVRGTPVGNVGVFQPGSNYNGATVYPVMDPATFLASVAFPYAHPQAGPPQVLERKPPARAGRGIGGWRPDTTRSSPASSAPPG